MWWIVLELPRRGDPYAYPQHMFLGVLNTVFLNISNFLPHLELRNRSIQIVVITDCVVISNVEVWLYYIIPSGLIQESTQFKIHPFYIVPPIQIEQIISAHEACYVKI